MVLVGFLIWILLREVLFSLSNQRRIVKDESAVQGGLVLFSSAGHVRPSALLILSICTLLSRGAGLGVILEVLDSANNGAL